jgi:hypothetical protein
MQGFWAQMRPMRASSSAGCLPALEDRFGIHIADPVLDDSFATRGSLAVDVEGNLPADSTNTATPLDCGCAETPQDCGKRPNCAADHSAMPIPTGPAKSTARNAH